MVFSVDETKEVEGLKQKNKVEFEVLRHANKMAELAEELKIAVAGGA